MVDNVPTSHMTRTWDIFLIISELGLGHIVNGANEVRGVGRVIFQVEFRELLEIEGFLFIPRLGENLLSVSALENVSYGTLFK